MRLRNVPGADAYLTAHPLVIKNETRYRGTWKETFQNPENPIHIEIGMGKGQFLLTLAKENPSINYIGIERYSSVLLRALERFDNDEEYKDVNNIRFICMDATNLPEVFAVGEIDKIYLNFQTRGRKHVMQSADLLPSSFSSGMTRSFALTESLNLRQTTESCLTFHWSRWSWQVVLLAKTMIFTMIRHSAEAMS